jgi:endonuclease YncB( thermonuclease family)
VDKPGQLFGSLTVGGVSVADKLVESGAAKVLDWGVPQADLLRLRQAEEAARGTPPFAAAQ